MTSISFVSRWMDYLSGFTATKAIDDDRTAEYYFSVPGLGVFALGPPIALFWVHLAMYISVASAINAICAVIVWFGVVKTRGSTGTSAYLVTYGVIVPFTLILPYFLVKYSGVQNVVLSIPMIILPPLNILRCLEALYGTSRAYVERNFHQFFLYYTSPVTFVFDRKTGEVQASTKGEIMSKLSKLLPGLVEITLLLNLVLASDHYVFPPRKRETLLDFFHWGNLMNNLALAYLTEIYLEFGSRSAAIVISLATGLETIEVNDNPLSKSTSVSEFWGKRWNRLVGELLRVGIFKPTVQSMGSKKVAVLVTFMASGFYHEFILLVRYCLGSFEPNFSAQLFFFVWNGFMLLVEEILSQNETFLLLSSKIPPRLKNVLVLLTVLPVAHWFLDEYVACGVYKDFGVAFPLIKML